MSGDQLQPEDTLDDRGVDDVLDEGYSPPEREPRSLQDPATAGESETLDERLAEEEPEVWDRPDEADATEEDPEAADVGQVGDERTGRLAEEWDDSVDNDQYGQDVGIDGAGASAEEAAIHTVED